MRPLAACAAVLAMTCLWGDVHAQEVRTLAESAGWSAYRGTTSSGQRICGMAASGGGRWIGIKYFEGDSRITIQLSKDTWKVRNGLDVKVTMQFDDLDPWSATANSFHMDDGDGALQFGIGSRNIGQFAMEFVRSNTLYVRFPNQDTIGDWQVDLEGTPQVTLAWARCLKSLAAVADQFTWE